MVAMPRLDRGVADWRAALRRVEDLGYSTVAISDHFTQGWAMEPLVTLAAAAAATDRLRLATLVLGNDYRHPVLVHKAAATLDVLSGGRVELGMGAGWMRSDYEAAGIPLDPPPVRLARLEEAVVVVKRLFEPAPVHFAGEHYRVSGLEGLPQPVQSPHPPIAVGGGGRRALTLAGRVADIASVYAQLHRGSLDVHPVLDMAPERVRQKVGFVYEGAASARRQPHTVELQLSLLACHLVASKGDAGEFLRETARSWGVPTATLASSPSVLIGTVDRCADLLEERREQYGFSYIHVGRDAQAAAPLVARLASR